MLRLDLLSCAECTQVFMITKTPFTFRDGTLLCRHCNIITRDKPCSHKRLMKNGDKKIVCFDCNYIIYKEAEDGSTDE